MISAYRVELAPGEILFREGDPPTTAFLIDSGKLRITTQREGRPLLLGELGPGALVGEMAVLDDSTRTATASAIVESVLTPIDRAQFAERLHAADPVVRALLLSQLSRYRHALATFTGQTVAVASGVSGGAESDFALDKIRLENQLREALGRDELEIRLQPILEINSGKLAGFEALTRWNHPLRGAVSPVDFITLAEETSLIVPVGEYVIREVCSCLRRMLDEIPGTRPFIAVNVSGRQIEDPSLIDRILKQVHDHDVPPEHLKLEITESLILDYVKVAALIDVSHQAGMRVALDDFGTGYSSLEHLNKLRFDTLKLDQAFTRELDDPRCLAIVRAVVAMASAIGCDIVAEGVETRTQLTQLKALGCQYAQGYLVGKPLSIDDAMTALGA